MISFSVVVVFCVERGVVVITLEEVPPPCFGVVAAVVVLVHTGSCCADTGFFVVSRVFSRVSGCLAHTADFCAFVERVCWVFLVAVVCLVAGFVRLALLGMVELEGNFET